MIAALRRLLSGTAGSNGRVEDYESATRDLPRMVNLGASDQRERLVMRLLGGFLMLSMTVNGLLGIGLYSLLPLKTVEPYFLSVSTPERVVYRVEPLRPARNSWQVLKESVVRQFIINRHGIVPDRSVATQRSAWIQRHASQDVHAAYAAEMRNPILHAIENGWRREVQDLLVEEQVEGLYIATWREVNLLPDRDGEPVGGGARLRRAEIRLQQVQMETPRDLIGTDLLNPFGLVISSYRVETREAQR